jgi:hypothetical protein
MPAVALLGSDLANNGDGNGIIVGELTNLNIPSYSINQELYVGAGAIATTKPTTGEVQSVGVVARNNTNTGIIVVNMQGRRDAASDTDTPNTIVLRDSNGTSRSTVVEASGGILTTGSEASIQTRFTFRLYNGNYTTILSHSPTAERAIAFPDKSGTVVMVDAETHTGAHAFSSTTRPTSAGTGTPAATSLITLADLIERGGRRLSAQLVADEAGNDNTTTLKTSATLTLALEVGLYHIESLIIVSAGTLFATVGTRQKLAFTGTGTFSGTQSYSAQNGAATSSTYPNSRGANAVDAEQLFSANSSATLRHGTLNVTVAGNLVVQWAQRTAGVGSAPTLNPPSYIRAQRIS